MRETHTVLYHHVIPCYPLYLIIDDKWACSCVYMCMRMGLCECQYVRLCVRHCSRGTCVKTEVKIRGEGTKMIRQIFDREEKRTPAKMTEVEKRRRDERGSCSVWGCGWWDISLGHGRADILMESIMHAKWVTGWVSCFHATRHRVPSISLSLQLQLSAGLFFSLGKTVCDLSWRGERGKQILSVFMHATCCNSSTVLCTRVYMKLMAYIYWN